MRGFGWLAGVALAAVTCWNAARAQAQAQAAGAVPAAPPAHDMSAMTPEEMANMPGMKMSAMDMSKPMAMVGALGGYPSTRDSSGTSWQPDASLHDGVMTTIDGWMLMGHALINGVYDWQGGPRGGQMAFGSGMIMGMAQKSFADGDSLLLRAMLSPEPAMGKAGYPLLLASGETANGTTPLLDRQHPHDFFMELSATYSHRLTKDDSLFLYGGLPGEPAFGPPAFMHRQSILDSPEAPISHHWLDSTHITEGVVTGGWVHGDWKVEVSGFRGREPDPHRWDIETPKLDSVAARLSWNPTRNLALQASWADQTSPEQLSPAQNERRWSASAIYTVPLGAKGWWSTTAAWGQRQGTGGPTLDAEVLESAVKPSDPWTVFARWERTRTDELTLGVLSGQVATVAKVSLGVIHDWRVADHVKFGVGGLYAVNFVPNVLAASYGRGDPRGAMGFVRVKVE